MSLNITSKQTTIKIGSHKGEEKYVMKVDHYSTVGVEKIIQRSPTNRKWLNYSTNLTEKFNYFWLK